jgi:branched-chain amino acid transport system permease protein
MNYILGVLTLILIYAILSLSLNLLIGYSGILSMAHAAVFGVGAYVTAILMERFGWSFIPALLVAMVAAGLISIAVALPSLRVSGDFFVVASFGTQFVLNDIYLNWSDVTGGAAGIPGIPPLDIFGWRITGQFSFVIVTAIFVALCYLAVRLLLRSPFGWNIEAVRQDEVATMASGRSPRNIKYMVSLVSGILAGVGGALFAVYMAYIDYSSFTLEMSIYFLTFVILGGVGTILGSFVGPLILVTVTELLTFLPLGSSAAILQQMVYGLILILLMFFRPQGILGRKL